MTSDSVRVSVQVSVAPDVAFQAFTRDLDRWWGRGPAYRVGGRRPGVLAFEPRAGGHLTETFETTAGSRTHVAGTILAWDPPFRLLFEWKAVNFREHERTEVEVTFSAFGSGTRVTLVHRGFAAIPADHPVRHGEDDAAFIRSLGSWWGQLLSSLRRFVTPPD